MRRSLPVSGWTLCVIDDRCRTAEGRITGKLQDANGTHNSWGLCGEHGEQGIVEVFVRGRDVGGPLVPYAGAVSSAV
jgi:hypothetical protein